MIFELGWKVWAAIAAIVTLISLALYWFGIIPWWGVLIAVPVSTVSVIGVLIVFAVLAWLAGGAH